MNFRLNAHQHCLMYCITEKNTTINLGSYKTEPVFKKKCNYHMYVMDGHLKFSFQRKKVKQCSMQNKDPAYYI